jgi:endopeptidase La
MLLKSNDLLVLIINDMVILPGNEVRVEYSNIYDENINNIVNNASTGEVLIVNPIEEDKDDITNLPKYGVLGKIKFKMNIPNGKTRIVVEGLYRVEIYNYKLLDTIYQASYKQVPFTYDEEEDPVYYKLLINTLDKYVKVSPAMGNAIMSQLPTAPSLDQLTDLIVSFLDIDYRFKKEYVTITEPLERAKLLLRDMHEQMKLEQLERKIEEEVDKELNETQKEYFLNEKIKQIQKELGETSTKDMEISNFKKKLSKLKCPKNIKEKINREISRLESMHSNSPELGMVREYIDWMINLPWQVFTKDKINLKEVKETMDNTHYALNDAKERIIEYLAIKQNNPDSKSPIICLVGPPGVGKTSLALSIAKALNRKSVKMSVGGINDEAEIFGHRRTYIGSNPGRIIEGLRKAGTSNPVFIIDELDKMTKDYKGDPASALLEVLDKEQNDRFKDHYIEEEYDLSKVMFIATANYREQIPYELQDRLEIIELSSYTEYEKYDIAVKYLIPKALDNSGLTQLNIEITDESIMKMIRNYTKEAGVRELERVIDRILRKAVKEILLENKTFIKVDDKILEKYLGIEKYNYTKNEDTQIGVVNGMAYTSYGGDILPIEVTMYKGKGNLILTGSLGEVMKESCKIAISYVKTILKEIGVEENQLEENDIHIHAPEGAVPKDGPSAGIALTSAIISMLKKQAVSNTISMTGEITLTGRVLPIGGLKEKSIGAHRAGIKKVFIPKENEKDLTEVPEEIKNNLEYILVENYKEVYEKLF